VSVVTVCWPSCWGTAWSCWSATTPT